MMTDPTSPRSYTILHTESSLGWGGQEHRILLEAGAMRERGHRLALATDPRSELFSRGRHAGFPVFPLTFGGVHNLGAFLALRRLLQEEAVEILHTHSSLDSWIGALAWRTLRKRPLLVRTRHLSTPVQQTWPTRWLYQRPAAVITTSRDIKELLARRVGVPASRLFSIPTGVSLPEFSPRPKDPDLLARLGFPASAFIIGSVAVLRSWKGHLYLLEAIKDLINRSQPVYLLLVGEGPYRPVIEERIQELSLGERVRLVGHQEEVAAWLALMDAFVLSSYAHEGVSQALLQALAMEKPVVATRIGGTPEVVSDGETGLLVPPRDGPALARAMQTLRENPEMSKRLADQGRKLVTAKFSLEQMAAAVEGVYDRMVGKGG
ncbi:MAG: glycosyltransferase family 4 protein [Thermodesulfobacteriota bacterium]